MKKTMKQVVSLALVLAVCICISTSALAVNGSTRRPETGYANRLTVLYRDMPYANVTNVPLMELQPRVEKFRVISYAWDDKQDSSLWVYVEITYSRDSNCVGWRGYVAANDVSISEYYE